MSRKLVWEHFTEFLTQQFPHKIEKPKRKSNIYKKQTKFREGGRTDYCLLEIFNKEEPASLINKYIELVINERYQASSTIKRYCTHEHQNFFPFLPTTNQRISKLAWNTPHTQKTTQKLALFSLVVTSFRRWDLYRALLSREKPWRKSRHVFSWLAITNECCHHVSTSCIDFQLLSDAQDGYGRWLVSKKETMAMMKCSSGRLEGVSAHCRCQHAFILYCGPSVCVSYLPPWMLMRVALWILPSLPKGKDGNEIRSGRRRC